MSIDPLDLRVAELYQETSQALRLVLDDSGRLSYQSGQYLTLLLDIDGHHYRRCYSFCSIPEDSHPEIIIKRIKGGRVSNYLNDTLRVGQRLRVLPPLGHFTTDYPLDRGRVCVFIGGGSGITPLISLLRSVLLRAQRDSALLLYGNRAPDQVILASLLEEMQITYPDRLRVEHVWEQGPSDGAYLLGRLSKEMQLRLLSTYIECPSEATYFLCGPQPMRLASRATLEELNVPVAQIHEECFTEDESPPEARALSDKQKVRILLQDEDQTLEVAPGDTVLEAGLEAGLEMPYSCQKGICTACRGRLLQGSIKYKCRTDALSEEEVEEGYILCCIAEPQTDLLIEIT